MIKKILMITAFFVSTSAIAEVKSTAIMKVLVKANAPALSMMGLSLIQVQDVACTMQEGVESAHCQMSSVFDPEISISIENEQAEKLILALINSGIYNSHDEDSTDLKVTKIECSDDGYSSYCHLIP